jgi:hypothetical protein
VNSSPPTVPELREHLGGFSYGYRMQCECGQSSYLSAGDYFDKQSDDALMDCEHCSRTIHFGPAGAALRDEDDPALGNDMVARLAWYHTSTWADWPSDSYAIHTRAELSNGLRHHGIRLDRIIDGALVKALHVGTYEAAIENMLRRMRDQAGATSEFYLHRVALRLDPSRIETGYRDENHEPAAQLTIDELRSAGLEAVRYLNVHEAVGSLSLAVARESIAYVQTIRLPVVDLVPVRKLNLDRQLGRLQRQLDEIRRAMPDTSGIDPTRLRIMQLDVKRDPDGIGASAARAERRQWALWDALAGAVDEHLLDGISPVVREDFRQAADAWRREQSAPDVASVWEFCSASAVSLTRSVEVIEILSRQPPRTASADATHA